MIRLVLVKNIKIICMDFNILHHNTSIFSFRFHEHLKKHPYMMQLPQPINNRRCFLAYNARISQGVKYMQIRFKHNLILLNYSVIIH